MKHPLLFALVLTVILASCSKEAVEIPPCDNCSFTCIDTSNVNIITNDCIPNWLCSFSYTKDSRVELDAEYGVAEGDKIAFQMINETEGEDWIADDEFTNILVFEIDQTQTSFSVEDEALNDMRVYYKSICYCSEVMFREATAGCMQGTELSDGSWRIQGSVTITYSFGDIQINFDAVFNG